ncbi:hypothetical protein RRG08_025804 [Elysia crispata]|uniref:PiggyBac transposable element-derived protein domain-containing protein n=2 Tax=Elysia crispata TaxID=231223 RepID=A0AAE1CRU2_9GAST|nr:hypothetical protein RRG08_025804 [Elysia crispata]
MCSSTDTEIPTGASRGDAPSPNPTIDANGWTRAADGKEVGGSRFRNLNSGSQLDLGEAATPYEFFKSLVTDEILDDLVNYINSFAGVVLQKNNPLKKHSRLHQWDLITRLDFLRFLAILISIGIDHRPKISDYWSTKSYMYTPWYSKQMPRNIFQLILHTMLHASEPNTEGKAKIEPFVQKLVAQFQRCFYPYEALSLDEMVIGYKGRFAHKQFNAAKPHKYHIKTFGLCDAMTGYVVNLLIYFGRHTAYIETQDRNSEHAIKVFNTLLEPFHPHHHIFADRYYTTFALIEFLRKNGYNYTGTVQVNRRGFAMEWKQQRLTHMQAVWHYKEDVALSVTWKDKKAKKPCHVVTTCSKVDYVTVQEGLRQVTKPAIIQSYNNNMNGCDRIDQQVSYYGAHDRKTKKWYKKIFTWILEVAQVNSHILHTLSRPEGTKPLPLAAYKNLLVDQLILVGAPNVMPALPAAAPTPPAKPGRKSVNPAEERLSGNRHLVDHDGLDRQCVYCSLMNKKKRSTYYCSGCEGRPHLCPKECFRKYHTDRVL